MAKTVEISTESIKKAWSDFQAKVVRFYNDANVWVNDYFSRIDTYGMIAVGVIALGFILFIAGILIL